MSKKICLIFTVILLTSMILTYSVTYRVYAQTIETTVNGLMEQAAETMVTALDDTIELAKLITISPLFSTDLQNAFRSGGNLMVKQQESTFFLTFLNSMPLSNHAACFYAENGTIIFSRLPNLCYSLFEDNYQEWKTIAEPCGGTAVIVATDADTGYSCAVLRSVIDTEYFDDIGLASVCISASDFDRAFERIHSISGGRAIVLDSLKRVIYDSDQLLQNCSIDDDLLIASLSRQNGRYTVALNGASYTGVNVAQSSGQYQILVFSPRQELLAQMRATQREIMLLVVGVCIVAFLMILFMSRTLTVPLKKITALMMRVQNGDFSVRFKSKTEDEIGVLGNNFNLLLVRLNQQIEDIVSISNKKKQMEIDILKSQINPHFIYNTLETIHMMAIDAEQPEIEQMSKVFGRLMRYNITSINEGTSLREELAYLKDYLYIQNVRFHGRFQMVLQVEPEVMNCGMLKMLLQPIVENAIMHGLEPSGQTGIIRICATRCQQSLVITISDNGIGIDEDTLAQIRQGLHDGLAVPTTCIGLRNVNSRIRLYYGEQYGLKIHSQKESGTTIEMRIPFIGGEDDPNCISG